MSGRPPSKPPQPPRRSRALPEPPYEWSGEYKKNREALTELRQKPWLLRFAEVPVDEFWPWQSAKKRDGALQRQRELKEAIKNADEEPEEALIAIQGLFRIMFEDALEGTRRLMTKEHNGFYALVADNDRPFKPDRRMPPLNSAQQRWARLCTQFPAKALIAAIMPAGGVQSGGDEIEVVIAPHKLCANRYLLPVPPSFNVYMGRALKRKL